MNILASRQVHRFRNSQFDVEITGLSSSHVSTLEDACEDSYTPTTKTTSGGRNHRVYILASRQVHRPVRCRNNWTILFSCLYTRGRSYTPTTKTTSGGRNHRVYIRQVHRFRHTVEPHLRAEMLLRGDLICHEFIHKLTWPIMRQPHALRSLFITLHCVTLLRVQSVYGAVSRIRAKHVSNRCSEFVL